MLTDDEVQQLQFDHAMLAARFKRLRELFLSNHEVWMKTEEENHKLRAALRNLQS